MNLAFLISVVWLLSTIAAFACTETRFHVLHWNGPTVASSLEVLFPEVLFEYDAGATTLKATGCKGQLETLKSLIDAANTSDPARWDAEVNKRLWESSLQRGTFQHSVYGFSLRKPPLEWKIASVLPDSAYASRLGGRAIFGLTFYFKQDALLFLVVDLDGVQMANEIAQPDSTQPLALWPQAMREQRWTDNVLGPYMAPRGGLATPSKSSYRTRTLWNTGAEKVVCDRIYFAQPSASGDLTRLYFFMARMSESAYRARRQALENFVAGFTLPDRVMQPTLAKAPASFQQASAQLVSEPKESAPAQYEWQLLKNPSPQVQEALTRYQKGDAKQAETLWQKLLPRLSQSDRAEALWFLARCQMQQGDTRSALATWQRFEKEAAQHPLAFEAALTRGILLGHRLREWDQAGIEWQRAAKLAHDHHQRWQADAKLATVPYYKKQYRPALEALEGLLRQYPTAETADFVRPYLWYLKNCAEKKI